MDNNWAATPMPNLDQTAQEKGAKLPRFIQLLTLYQGDFLVHPQWPDIFCKESALEPAFLPPFPCLWGEFCSVSSVLSFQCSASLSVWEVAACGGKGS